uniref:Uncharacterized protein n=1 Tax=Rhizophora mucronata TaxID=61149 RepID=A0A2P2L7Z7_RHIMU
MNTSDSVPIYNTPNNQKERISLGTTTIDLSSLHLTTWMWKANKIYAIHNTPVKQENLLNAT